MSFEIFFSPHKKKECYKCADRSSICHSTCARYAKEDIEHQQEIEDRRKRAATSAAIDDIASKNKGRFV